MALVSPLFAECGGNTTEKIRVALRVISGPTVNITAKDSVHLLEIVFNLLSSGIIHDRVTFWNLIPILANSDYLSLAAMQLSQVASKMHHYIQTAKDHEERSAICTGLRAILEVETHFDSIGSKLENIFPKLMTTVLKLTRDISPADTHFGLQLLHTLCQHRGRAINVSHGGAITSACVNIILLQSSVCSSGRSVTTGRNISLEVRSLAATVLALHTSFGSPEQYESVWLNLTQEYANVLSTLGLLRRPVSASSFPKSISSGTTASSASTGSNVRGSGSGGLSSRCRGASRALELEVIFQGITRALMELHWHGCAAGPVCVDMSTHLTAALGAAVCHRVDVKPTDPKFGIPNAAYIAPMHVVLVSNQLRVHALTLLEALMRQVQPSAPSSSLLDVCCTCLSSVFNTSSEVVKMQYTATAAVQKMAALGVACLCSAVRCYPTVIVQRCSKAVQSIVMMLCSAMALETSTGPSLESTADLGRLGSYAQTPSRDYSLGNASSRRCALPICDLMHAVEMLLLMAAPLIDVEVRQSMEYVVAVGLKCAAKGVMTSDSYGLSPFAANDTLLSLGTSSSGKSGSIAYRPQKRMRRAVCEPLRVNMDALQALLRLAQAEVAAPYADSSRSGNLALLRNVVMMCVGVSELTVEATRAARYIEAVLFPLASNIPGVPVGPVAVDAFPIDSYSISQAESAIVSHLRVPVEASTKRTAGRVDGRNSALDDDGDSMNQTDDIPTGTGIDTENGQCDSNDKSGAIPVNSATTSISQTNDASKGTAPPLWKKRLYSSTSTSPSEVEVTASDIKTSTKGATTVAGGASADSGGSGSDSDDELPDIDIEAEPDQN